MIQLENVSFKYSEAQAPSLTDLSLTIPQGQCVLFCGESGCGKTTLTRLINGLIPHYYEGEMEGKVTVGKLNVTEAEMYETAAFVGSVFQNPRSQFFCVDTTSEVAFGCENMGMPEKEILGRIDEAAEELKMKHLLDRNIFELSGGEKQKVACASVSAVRPPVMVLDEPTSNLDADAIGELRDTVRLWKKEGKTVVIAEHRLYWLTDICDRVVYLRNGRIEADISMQEFCSYPAEKLREMGLRTLKADFTPMVTPESFPETLELRDFKFAYGDRTALDIPSLSLPKGAIVAVIGNNGAGKSTFTRCLCGLQKKFRGYTIMDGKRLHRRKLLSRCYMVMQDVNHQLFCETVEDEIQLGMKKDLACDVADILKYLDLAELSERHPMSLSGGQKQRVAIASAILADKSLLVFDEPTSGLDYRHMEATGKLIASLKGKRTVLIVTHDPELICRSCTHVLQLEKGKANGIFPMDSRGAERIRKFFSAAQ